MPKKHKHQSRLAKPKWAFAKRADAEQDLWSPDEQCDPSPADALLRPLHGPKSCVGATLQMLASARALQGRPGAPPVLDGALGSLLGAVLRGVSDGVGAPGGVEAAPLLREVAPLADAAHAHAWAPAPDERGARRHSPERRHRDGGASTSYDVLVDLLAALDRERGGAALSATTNTSSTVMPAVPPACARVSALRSLLEGEFASRTTCCTCGTCTSRHTPFWTLTLPVAPGLVPALEPVCVPPLQQRQHSLDGGHAAHADPAARAGQARPAEFKRSRDGGKRGEGAAAAKKEDKRQRQLRKREQQRLAAGIFDDDDDHGDSDDEDGGKWRSRDSFAQSIAQDSDAPEASPPEPSSDPPASGEGASAQDAPPAAAPASPAPLTDLLSCSGGGADRAEAASGDPGGPEGCGVRDADGGFISRAGSAAGKGGAAERDAQSERHVWARTWLPSTWKMGDGSAYTEPVAGSSLLMCLQSRFESSQGDARFECPQAQRTRAELAARQRSRPPRRVHFPNPRRTARRHPVPGFQEAAVRGTFDAAAVLTGDYCWERRWGRRHPYPTVIQARIVCLPPDRRFNRFELTLNDDHVDAYHETHVLADPPVPFVGVDDYDGVYANFRGDVDELMTRVFAQARVLVNCAHKALKTVGKRDIMRLFRGELLLAYDSVRGAVVEGIREEPRLQLGFDIDDFDRGESDLALTGTPWIYPVPADDSDEDSGDSEDAATSSDSDSSVGDVVVSFTRWDEDDASEVATSAGGNASVASLMREESGPGGHGAAGSHTPQTASSKSDDGDDDVGGVTPLDGSPQGPLPCLSTSTFGSASDLENYALPPGEHRAAVKAVDDARVRGVHVRVDAAGAPAADSETSADLSSSTLAERSSGGSAPRCPPQALGASSAAGDVASAVGRGASGGSSAAATPATLAGGAQMAAEPPRGAPRPSVSGTLSVRSAGGAAAALPTALDDGSPACLPPGFRTAKRGILRDLPPATRPCRQRTDIVRVPPLLVFHLDRFTVHPHTQTVVKDPTRVLFPFRLSMDVHPDAPAAAAATAAAPPAEYRLVAVVEHVSGKRAGKHAERDQHVCYAWRPTPPPPTHDSVGSLGSESAAFSPPPFGAADAAAAARASLWRQSAPPTFDAVAASAPSARGLYMRPPHRSAMECELRGPSRDAAPPPRIAVSSSLRADHQPLLDPLFSPRADERPGSADAPRHRGAEIFPFARHRGSASFDGERRSGRSSSDNMDMRPTDGATMWPGAADAAFRRRHRCAGMWGDGSRDARGPPGALSLAFAAGGGDASSEASPQDVACAEDWEELADSVPGGGDGSMLTTTSDVLQRPPRPAVLRRTQSAGMAPPSRDAAVSEAAACSSGALETCFDSAALCCLPAAAAGVADADQAVPLASASSGAGSFDGGGSDMPFEGSFEFPPSTDQLPVIDGSAAANGHVAYRAAFAASGLPREIASTRRSGSAPLSADVPGGGASRRPSEGDVIPEDDARDMGVWHMITEDGVAVVPWQAVATCEAFMLMYERVKGRVECK